MKDTLSPPWPAERKKTIVSVELLVKTRISLSCSASREKEKDFISKSYSEDSDICVWLGQQRERKGLYQLNF